MSARADIAWSRQLSGISRGQLALWGGAGAIALSAHATAAWLAMREPAAPPVLEAASAAIEVDLAALGFTSADQLSAGEVAEPVATTAVAEAVTQTTEAVEARRVPPAETPPPERAEPVEQARPVETARVQEAAPIRPQAVEPVRQVQRPATPQAAERARQPDAPAPAAETPPPEQPAAVAAEAVPSPLVESTVPEAESEVAVAAVPPAEREQVEEPERAEAVEVETAEPVPEEEQEVAALVHVPLPTPRPDYTPTAMPRPERPRTEPQRQVERQQPAPRQAQRTPPRQSGSGGRNQADSRKGVADGSAQGRAETRSQGGQRSTAGNAAVSNYPGQVASRLRRALRYPAEARRERLRGEVHVSFTVDRSGGVGSVRVARSSGSSVLDKAAVETVRRAAPFPPIPDGAGRSSWPFTVPLAFTR